jgi:hypothetical protein
MKSVAEERNHARFSRQVYYWSILIEFLLHYTISNFIVSLYGLLLFAADIAF